MTTSFHPEPVSFKRIAVDVGIVVASMERSLGFYRDLLGLSVIAELTTSLIGQGRMVQLQHGASLIKLVEMETTPSPRHTIGIATTLGYRYITLLISDIHALMAKIEGRQIMVTLPMTQLSNGTMLFMVTDPDGNVVEFVQEV